MVLENEPGLTLLACQLRPESKGSIQIKSADPGRAARHHAELLWPTR